MISITFQYAGSTRWLSCMLPSEEYRGIMNSGLFDGKLLSCVLLWEHEYDDAMDRMIYSFIDAKKGLSPFTLQTTKGEG